MKERQRETKEGPGGGGGGGGGGNKKKKEERKKEMQTYEFCCKKKSCVQCLSARALCAKTTTHFCACVYNYTKICILGAVKRLQHFCTWVYTYAKA